MERKRREQQKGWDEKRKQEKGSHLFVSVGLNQLPCPVGTTCKEDGA
jgi:hypothetical protein